MPKHICASCGHPSASKICTGCSKVYYCTKTCQAADWMRHIFLCNPRRPITTADRLALDVREQRFPNDDQTRIEWGLEKASATISIDASRMLLDLYTDLIEYFGIKPSQLHKWRIQGRLIAEIKAVYEAFPAEKYNRNYQWFLEHQDILENPTVTPEDTEMHIDRTYRYVPLNHHGERASSSTPSVTRVATLPRSPISTSSLDSEHVVRGRSTQNFASVSPLKEFHEAYASGKLLDLFKRKNIVVLLRDESRRDAFADILGCMPHTDKLKTVWNVEQFITSQRGSGDVGPLLITAAIDYGYENCEQKSEWEAKLSDISGT
ncbi:hypothetical protein BDY19DRAFT_995488 [Irpex rosettiformis]|uniref:Uncharacterized protein n=1 Tax=Irpex rosettiformis TaxID=378272 RepID=A0ACB8TXJ8_9APHY|nr:hypothetical protein BDY19DRAFT_995488 [Irpex rosettiformis]